MRTSDAEKMNTSLSSYYNSRLDYFWLPASSCSFYFSGFMQKSFYKSFNLKKFILKTFEAFHMNPVDRKSAFSYYSDHSVCNLIMQLSIYILMTKYIVQRQC